MIKLWLTHKILEEAVNQLFNGIERNFPIREHELKYWEIFDRIGWGTRSTNVQMLRNEVREQFTVQELKELREFAITKRRELKAIVESYDTIRVINVGSDGYWDLLAHCVGLGKDFYYQACDNPDLVFDLAEGRHFRENFEYIFSTF